MSKVNHTDKQLFPGGINSGVGGKLFVALTTDDVQVDATGVTIDMSASTAGAVWTMTVGTSTDTYTTAAVTSTTASKALTVSTGTSTPATAITGGATGALTSRSGNSVANHAGATGGNTGAWSGGSGNASSTLGTSGQSGAVTLSSGNSEDGNSGDVNITVGTAGGTRGNINLSATDIAVTGNLKTNNLGERGVDAGITLDAGSEIVGVPKMVKAATAYNLADGALFTVPAGETWLITDLFHITTTSWDGDGTAKIGVTADDDGFLVLANASLVTTYDESGGITGWPTGSRGLELTNRGVLLSVATSGYARQFKAVAGTTILWDATPGTSSVGVGVCYMTYIRLP